MKFSLLFSAIFILGACSNAKFESSNNAGLSNKKRPTGESTMKNAGSGDANRSGEGLAAGEKAAQFSFGPKSAVADFLFIFDNSGSMKASLDQLRAGFESLSGAAWPSDTRIGVMTTLPGDPNDLSKIHPAVKTYPNIELDPGFLNLLSEAGRKRFIDAAGTTTDAIHSFNEPMCAGEWFKPSDTTTSGKPCLSAAIQSPFFGVGVEAGLVALSQIVKKRQQMFRKGTNVNVVFISDTQDPGTNAPTVQALRPTFAQIKALIDQNSSVAGVRLHGVTPSETCTTNEGTPSRQDSRGLPYQDAILASGGVWLDFCDGANIRTDYKPVAEQIVAGALAQPAFVLPQSVSKIVKVMVAGTVYPADKVVLSADKTTVRLDGLAPKADVAVEIIYLP